MKLFLPQLVFSLGLSATMGSGFAAAQSGTPLDEGIDDLVLVEPVDPEGWFMDYIICAIAGAGDAPTRDALLEDYDDDGDLDLYVINSPGGDNALLGGIGGIAGSGEWGAVVQDDGDFLIYLRDTSIPDAPADSSLAVVESLSSSRNDNDGVLHLFSVDPPNASTSGINALILLTQSKSAIGSGTYDAFLSTNGESLDLFLAAPEFGDGTIQIRMSRSGAIPEPSAVCLLLAGAATCFRHGRQRT